MNTRIEGKKVNINKPRAEVYSVLANPANFQKVMPSDVTKFEADENSFVFGLKGMPEIRMVFSEKVENEKLVLKAASSKLDVALNALFEDADGNTQAQLIFEGDFNPMLKMMVERPLRNFVEKLTEQLHKL